jgi:ubiquinone/menaquinone biosynthesis C-methylase UbiE
MRAERAEGAINFDDGAAYERFMGRWSRAAGRLFLDWLAPKQEARWLELGCGTGAFTQLLNERCVPAEVVAIDPSAAQIAYAREHIRSDRITFHVGSAEAVASADRTFDYVVSALAINFMPDRPAALREMSRVVRLDGTIAGYVWEFASHRTPQGPLVRVLSDLGVACPVPPGGNDCTPEALHGLFANAGLSQIETKAIEIEVRFQSFQEFWTAQRPRFSPTTRLIDRLTAAQRNQLIERLHVQLPVRKDGSMAYAGQANAVKASFGDPKAVSS